MAHVLAFANQKGGVAKTTSTVNLGVALARWASACSAVDMDPQGNLTMSQGIDTEGLEKSMYDVLVHRLPIEDVIVSNEIDVAAATIDLAGAEMALSTHDRARAGAREGAQARSRSTTTTSSSTRRPRSVCSPSTRSTASDGVIVPVQCEYLSLRGLLQLERTLEMIRENLNPKVKIKGILPTLFDARTAARPRGRRGAEGELRAARLRHRRAQDDQVRRGARAGPSVLKYDPRGKGAEAYRSLAREVLNGKSA